MFGVPAWYFMKCWLRSSFFKVLKYKKSYLDFLRFEKGMEFILNQSKKSVVQ